MARRPASFAQAQAQAIANIITQLSRTRRALAQYGGSEVVQSARRAIPFQLSGESRRQMINVYNFSAVQMVNASLQGTLRNMSEQTAEAVLKTGQAIELATVGENPQDNADLKQIAIGQAATINQNILETYLGRFSGRSYRQGDSSRRSGEIETFLRQGTIADVEGQNVTVSLRDAVGNPRVPHIFRLNYGTHDAPGSKPQGKHPVAPPTFTMSIVGGRTVSSAPLAGDKRPAFSYPGGRFSYVLSIGPGDSVRLHPNSQGISGRRPAAGIAPSYFVEQGVANSADEMAAQYQALFRNWRRRVARIRGQDLQLR